MLGVTAPIRQDVWSKVVERLPSGTTVYTGRSPTWPPQVHNKPTGESRHRSATNAGKPCAPRQGRDVPVARTRPVKSARAAEGMRCGATPPPFCRKMLARCHWHTPQRQWNPADTCSSKPMTASGKRRRKLPRGVLHMTRRQPSKPANWPQQSSVEGRYGDMVTVASPSESVAAPLDFCGPEGQGTSASPRGIAGRGLARRHKRGLAAIFS